MSEYGKIPPTPKMVSVSLPDPESPCDSKNSKGSRRRLSSLFGKNKWASASRSMTPAPVPSRHEYSPPGPSHRPRASSMTSRPFYAPDTASKSMLNALAPRFSEPARGGSSKAVQYPTAFMSQTAAWMSTACPVVPDKHRGLDTPKYMKATVKEVAIKEESIALSWPLVPYADRRHLKYPLLYYDVAFDPREDVNVKDNRRTYFLALPERDRELPVSTHCKLTEMVIDCPLVGSLVVARPEGLTCLDILYAIYQKYQKKPRSHELPVDTTKYLPAFEQRCIDCPGLTEYNRKVGFKRVDLLRGKRIFEGLRRVNGRWELLIDGSPQYKRHV